MESKFKGGVLDTVIAIFIAGLISGCSLGIAMPWAVAHLVKYFYEHTEIDGKQLVFEGNPSALFKDYIKWFLLTCVTFGIYGFWVIVKMSNWVAENTHVVE
jgi:uncharacterized membrane protein YjgN (DUF898 family)